jgi:hypothetical protein
MKLKIFVLVISLVLVSPIFADDSKEVKPVLKKGDVERFIKTFPLLKEEFKKFEVEYDRKAGSVTYPEALKASQEFLGILKKHGWDEHFFTKMATISMGYSMIVTAKELKNTDPQIAKAIKQIESNPHLSDAMKKQMLEQMKQVKGIMKNQQNVMKKNVQKPDMELIKPHIEELKKLFGHKKK